MPAITLNPGFVAILVGFLMLATPRTVRAPLMAGAALVALWLLLDSDFGAANAVAQMGLPVVLLDLDALNRIFGIALLITLISLAIFANARRNRYEDAAIMMMAGGAVSALFVGDLVSFVAASAFSGLAAAWVVFCSPYEGAGRSGARMLVWNGLEGLLMLVGVAFQLSSGAASSVFERLDIASLGGGFIFAALMIRIGAPLAHVWLKDAVTEASPLGAAALSAISNIVGIYALARLYPGEPALMWIGAAMILLGAAFAAAVDDVRKAAAYGQMTQTGVCVALLGVGSPLALAAAEGHAFTSMLAFAALQMTLGGMLERRGEVRFSGLADAARAMPISAMLLLGAGLAAAAAPGLAAYTTLAVGLDATAQWDLRWLWTLFAASSAAMFVCLALRPSLAAHVRTQRPASFREAPFSMLLGAAVAAFFSVSIGLAPGWLYGLMPTQVEFAPYAMDRVAPQLQLLGAAGAAFVLLRAFGMAGQERAGETLDIDTLYRGPLTDAGRWAGVLLLRVYGALRDQSGASARWVTGRIAAWTNSCDRPYPGRVWSALQLFAAAALVTTIFVTGFL